MSDELVRSWTEVPRDKALAELERVLGSPQFRSSKKCTRFLRHIVECAADSRFDCLKERTLGVDVFDRDPHYDTNQDPIVRGTAGEVRKRLAQYYVALGQQDEFRFSLPAGSYIPEVHRAAVAPVSVTLPETLPVAAAIPAIPPARRRSHWLYVAAAVAAIVVIFAVLIARTRQSPLQRFWAPLLDGYKTVLVCMGQPQEYTFHTDTARALNSWFAAGNQDAKKAALGFTSVSVSEIVPLWGNSIALADAQGFARIFNLFARMGKQADLRGERSVSLADLRGKPCILIGAFDNAWTLNLAGELRFYFDEDPRRNSQTIRDRRNCIASWGVPTMLTGRWKNFKSSRK